MVLIFCITYLMITEVFNSKKAIAIAIYNIFYL